MYNFGCPAVYSWSNSSGSFAPNAIEGNVIWNSHDVGIEAGNRTIIRNNIVFNNALPGIQLRSHSEVTAKTITVRPGATTGGGGGDSGGCGAGGIPAAAAALALLFMARRRNS